MTEYVWKIALMSRWNTPYRFDIKGILCGYAIRSGRRPEGSQRPQGGPQKYIVNKTIAKLWNYKSNDLPKNVLPACAWRHPPSRQLDKVSEGRAFFEEHWDCTKTTIASLNIYEVIYQKYITNRIESKKESIDWLSIIAVHSRCQGVVGCLAHVRAYSVKQ